MMVWQNHFVHLHAAEIRMETCFAPTYDPQKVEKKYRKKLCARKGHFGAVFLEFISNRIEFYWVLVASLHLILFRFSFRVFLCHSLLRFLLSSLALLHLLSNYFHILQISGYMLFFLFNLQSLKNTTERDVDRSKAAYIHFQLIFEHQQRVCAMVAVIKMPSVHHPHGH